MKKLLTSLVLVAFFLASIPSTPPVYAGDRTKGMLVIGGIIIGAIGLAVFGKTN